MQEANDQITEYGVMGDYVDTPKDVK